MDATERNRLIALYGDGYRLLQACLADIPKEMWQFRPEPGEWSVHEIIVHLADSESYSAIRARLLIAETEPRIIGYNPDKWATYTDYHSQSWEDALEVLRLARKTTHFLLEKLTDEVWQNAGTHSQSDKPYIFERWLQIYSGHIPDHINQIKNNQKVWNAQ